MDAAKIERDRDRERGEWYLRSGTGPTHSAGTQLRTGWIPGRGTRSLFAGNPNLYRKYRTPPLYCPPAYVHHSALGQVMPYVTPTEVNLANPKAFIEILESAFGDSD